MLTLLFATLSTGHASGYFYPDAGVSALGRGGANVAGSNDLSALWYNPAALRRISGNRFDLDLIGLDHYVRYTRASDTVVDDEGNTNVVSYDPVENTAAPIAIPTFAVASDFGMEKTTFAMGLYPPFAHPIHSYDDAGPQRYNLVSSELIQFAFGPAVAHELHEWVTLGVGLTGNFLRVKQDLDVHMFLPLSGFDLGDLGDPAGDVGFAVEAQDSFTLSANAGLLIEPPSGNWAFGFSFRPATTYEATGTIEADFSNHFLYSSEDPSKEIILEPTAKDDEILLTVNLPASLKAGFLVRPIDALEIEASFVWEGWHVNEALEVRDVNFLVDTTISPVEIEADVALPAGFKDSWSVRLGGHYVLNDMWTLRAGGLYETSAVPTSSLGLGQVDMDKVGYGTGVVFALSDRVSLDASFGQLFFETVEVTDSETTAIMVNAISGELEEDSPVVGNGIYESSVISAGLGLSWTFGR